MLGGYMKKATQLLLILLIYSCTINAQTNFQIVYNADFKYAKDSAWVRNIHSEWKATGINLRILWNKILNHAPSSTYTDSSFNWNDLDASINRIVRDTIRIINSQTGQITYDTLNLFIRINMCNTSISWAIPSDEYYCAADGTPYYNGYYNYANAQKMYSIFSDNAVTKMGNFISYVLDHIKNMPNYSTEIAKRLKLVVVTISQDDESDLPSHRRNSSDVDVQESVGFSAHEKTSFINFLISKYNYISTLNAKFGYSFSSFSDIYNSMNNWHWEKTGDWAESGYFITHPELKKDWSYFKTQKLRAFHSTIAAIVAQKGFNYGIQPGPIDDNLIEHKGTYDPTSLFEKANYMIVADGPGDYPHFILLLIYCAQFRNIGRHKTAVHRELNLGQKSAGCI